MDKDCELVRRLPIAKFFYQGNHTHPVRRTVVMLESKPSYIRGFELREGNEERFISNAPVKTFARNRIAKISEIDRRRKLRKTTHQNDWNRTTLNRLGFVKLATEGV